MLFSKWGKNHANYRMCIFPLKTTLNFGAIKNIRKKTILVKNHVNLRTSIFPSKLYVEKKLNFKNQKINLIFINLEYVFFLK
jgi:hypothetical protein